MIEQLPLYAGGQVVLLRRDPRELTLQTEFAAPPGSSIELLVSGSKVSFKVRSCRRLSTEGPARYCVEGRFVNLSRTQRAALELK